VLVNVDGRTDRISDVVGDCRRHARLNSQQGIDELGKGWWTRRQQR
jgi:hypothetical protein